MPVTSRFRFADAAFEVETASTADLAWLADYLGPDFAEDAWPTAPSIGFRVVLVHDAGLHASLAGRRIADPDAPRLVALALNQRDLMATRVRGEDGTPWLHEPVRDVYLRLDRRDVHLVGNGRSDQGRAMLMRVVRELAVDRTLHSGGAILHACALATPEGVVVIAGTEGAGKTSTLLSILAQGCAGYVANDRIAVWVDGDAVVGRGLPTLVGIRDGTFDLLAAIGERGRAAASGIHAAARTGLPDARRTSSGKVKLTPVDIDPVFGGGTVRAGGGVLGLVLPSVAGVAVDRVDIRAVPARDWTPERMLALECRRDFDRDIGEVFVTDAADETAARLRASSLAVKRTVVERLPAVEVALRPGVPITPDDWDRIVSTLVDGRDGSGA